MLTLVTVLLTSHLSAYGYDFMSDGLCYNILSENDRTVMVTYYDRWKNEDYVSGELVIPPKVIYDSKTYKVVSIGGGAFEDCSGLTSVTIPNSVTSIGSRAFYYCYGLTSVYCKATVPPTANNVPFGNSTIKGTLYVPTGCKDAYEAVDPWRNFWNIEEMDYSGVDSAIADEEAMHVSVENGMINVSGISDFDCVTVYDAQGRAVYTGTEHQIANLAPGLYIVKAGSATAKIRL